MRLNVDPEAFVQNAETLQAINFALAMLKLGVIYGRKAFALIDLARSILKMHASNTSGDEDDDGDDGTVSVFQCLAHPNAMRALLVLKKIPESLEELKSAEELNWRACKLTDEDMEMIKWIIEELLDGAAEMPVKKLFLDDNPRIRNRKGHSLDWVERLEALEVLEMPRCRFLESIPKGFKVIGEWAFSECSSLQSVDIPKGVKEIGKGAFSNCKSLESKGVKEIGKGAFSNCKSLESVTIPEGVEKIGEDAFNGCSRLESVIIPTGVNAIGERAFAGCSSLQSVTIPEGVKEIGEGAFARCTSLQSVTIPEEVEEIGELSFAGCSSLQSVTIPEGVKVIGEWAFSECSSLKSVTIPEGVKEIGAWAFNQCSSLRSVTIPEGVKAIGEDAFNGCSRLKSVPIPEGVDWPDDFDKGIEVHRTRASQANYLQA